MNYSVKNIKYLETSRGVAFTADLYEDSNKVGVVENQGMGGDTYCRAKPDLDEGYLEHILDVAEGIQA